MRTRQLVSLFVFLCCALVAAQDKLPRKGFFGAALQPAEGGGITVMTVNPGSTAEGGGIKVGDVILSMNGKPTNAVPELGAVISSTLPGSTIAVKLKRDSKEQTVNVKLLAKPDDKGDNYEVIYDHVVSKGARLRTFVSRPTKMTGKRPVLFIIQGIGQFSHDTPLTAPGAYNRICKAFSDKGFVTLRVDKPGIGDSEGKPFSQITWDEDVDAFRQAINSLKKYDFVDMDNIFIFGHSMGGCEGPMIASEFPVKGLAVYGTVTRTWHEYCQENIRRQSILAGGTHGAVDLQMRGLIAAMHLIFDENLTPAEAKLKYPQWASGIDGFSPDGRTMSGMPLTFWQGCFDENFGQYWEKVKCHVGAFFGENEFIASQVDHPMIADIVNRNNPGKGKYIVVPNSDHGFNKTTSMADSFRVWQPGVPKEFNPVIIEMLTKWVDDVMAGK